MIMCGIIFGRVFVAVSTIFGFFLYDVRALTNMHIQVPEAVPRGNSVTLVCNYDLESAALYTIKWYKDDEEFYRFVPKESPPSQVFDVPHINVELSESNSTKVTLRNAERGTSGKFKCEVTADAPLFHTDLRTAQLTVADVPEDDIVLRIESQKVAPGGRVRAICTTPGSHPGINITWFLNDEETFQHRDLHIQNSVIHFDALPGLETIQSTLSLKATPNIFIRGKLKLRCSASMFNLYSSSRESEVQEDAPQLALVMVPSASTNGGVCRASSFFLFILHIFIPLRCFQHQPG